MNIIRIERVMQKTSLGRRTIYDYVNQNRFPAPVKLSPRHVGWVEAEVDTWLKAQAQARPAAGQVVAGAELA